LVFDLWWCMGKKRKPSRWKGEEVKVKVKVKERNERISTCSSCSVSRFGSRYSDSLLG
jgi:hypothetical protein